MTYSYDDILEMMIDPKRSSNPVPPGEKGGCFSSYSRKSSYDDQRDVYVDWAANGDGTGYIRKENGRYVVFDSEGPGVIWRMWSAKPGEGHIRIYTEEDESPKFDMPFQSLFERL